MQDRTPAMMVFIAALVALAVYINWDVFVPGYDHPDSVTRFLTWQGEPENRSLELRRGLDLQGGLQVLLQVDPESTVPFEPGDLNVAATIIRNRVDSLGVTEALVQTQGEDKIVVELPGVDDPELAVRTIGETAQLEFIYGGDPSDPVQGPQVPREGDVVVTSLPVLFEQLPEEFQEPRLVSPEQLSELRGVTRTLPAGATTVDPEATDGATDGAADETAEPEDATETAEPEDATETGEPEDATETGEPEETTETGEPEETTATAETAQTEDATDIAETAEPDDAADDPDESEGLDTTPVRLYPTIITGANVRSASVARDQFNRPTVSFTLDNDGGFRLQRFTSQHLQQAMPIALDKRIISSPVVQATIASSGEITGDFTEEEANALVIQLRSGSLPVDLSIVGQTRIGPTLGAESVRFAVIGGIVGLAAVMMFMLLYYRVPGVLANLALVVYVLVSLSLFRLIPVTLTLAGIAGFVLSIGMAVDANILIFERMKEELRAGRRMRSAMETGFERAWPSIRDSNLSTLITCAILFWFGNQFGASIVKGFAVTLAIGVITSMFTAIMVTRTFLHLSNRVFLRQAMSQIPVESPRLRALFGI